MIITLPRGINIDIDHVPENLEEIVQKSFGEYTHGTSRVYTYEDRLMYIDVMMQNIWRADSGNDVKKLILSRFEYNLDDQGELTEPEEFLSVEFMQECYDLGRERARLRCRGVTSDRRDDEKIMKIIERVIRAVMNWETQEGREHNARAD